jgi:hypothetical protein
MAPWYRKVCTLPIAAAVVVSLTSSGNASINLPGALMVPAISAPKYCSGAFRYAARDGNSDIAPLSAVQMFASERRFARTRYAMRAMQGLEPERSRVHALTMMCGGR